MLVKDLLRSKLYWHNRPRPKDEVVILKMKSHLWQEIEDAVTTYFVTYMSPLVNLLK